MGKRGLTAKQRAFVREYVVDNNGTAAAKRAGYSERTASQIAYELLHNRKIQAAVDEQRERQDRLSGSRRHWILRKLEENVNRAMQAEPVLGADGKPIGVYRYAGEVANSALKLLGQNEGMFREQIDLRLQGAVQSLLEVARPFMKPESYADCIQGIARAMGISGLDSSAVGGDPEQSAAVH